MKSLRRLAVLLLFPPLILWHSPAFGKSETDSGDIILSAPFPQPQSPASPARMGQKARDIHSEGLAAPLLPSFKAHQPSAAPHYPEKSDGRRHLGQAGKIKGYVSSVNPARGMVQKEMNAQDADKFAPKVSSEQASVVQVIAPEAMNDASDLPIKAALSGTVPEIQSLPPRPFHFGNKVGERKFQIWFSLTPAQKELRDFIYPLIPPFLKACPTWESQLSGWTSCRNAIPEQGKFKRKLVKERPETQIQQWFFLNEMADVGASEDDLLRAQTFLARYFSELVEDQLQKEGWCYGPYWVPAAEQAWMKCVKMPLRSERPDSGWARYQRPAGAPKPRWPMPAG